jgi:predicted negative regulator of RcsB-dependent stress response
MRKDALPTLQPHWVDIEINQSRVRIIKVKFTQQINKLLEIPLKQEKIQFSLLVLLNLGAMAGHDLWKLVQSGLASSGIRTRQHAEAISQGNSDIQELADLQPAFSHSFEKQNDGQ